jgi:hypothetical protein
MCYPSSVANNDDQCKSLGFPAPEPTVDCPRGLQCEALRPTGFDVCQQPPVLEKELCSGPGWGFVAADSTDACPVLAPGQDPRCGPFHEWAPCAVEGLICHFTIISPPADNFATCCHGAWAYGNVVGCPDGGPADSGEAGTDAGH